jgi:hypothetical protein
MAWPDPSDEPRPPLNHAALCLKSSDNGQQGFKSVGSAQRFLSDHAAVYNTLNIQCHLISAKTQGAFRASAMDTWRAVTAAA